MTREQGTNQSGGRNRRPSDTLKRLQEIAKKKPGTTVPTSDLQSSAELLGLALDGILAHVHQVANLHRVHAFDIWNEINKRLTRGKQG